jgi:hypothetical protein
MKRSIFVACIVALAAALSAAPAGAWTRGGWGHGGRHGPPPVVVGFGPAWWWGGPFWYPPVPPVVVTGPPIVVTGLPVVGGPGPSGAYYYCPSSQEYYPKARTCSEPWETVPAAP